LSGPTQEDCVEGTRLLLSLLWKAGNKVSQKKTQICQDTDIPIPWISPITGQCRLGLRGNRLSATF
jgi:hypothetical protein